MRVFGRAINRRQIVVGFTVAPVAALGIGVGARAGILSRGESSGNGTTRGAGAALADPNGNGRDIVAVGESTATVDDEGDASSSATALRVGDVKVGDAPYGESNLVGELLNDQPTEDLVDGGCDDDPDETATQSCLALLHSYREESDEYGGNAFAYFATVEAYTPLTGYTVLLASQALQNYCYGEGTGLVAFGDPIPGVVDRSEETSNTCYD